jgi:hypothetical protein
MAFKVLFRLRIFQDPAQNLIPYIIIGRLRESKKGRKMGPWRKPGIME